MSFACTSLLLLTMSSSVLSSSCGSGICPAEGQSDAGGQPVFSHQGSCASVSTIVFSSEVGPQTLVHMTMRVLICVSGARKPAQERTVHLRSEASKLALVVRQGLGVSLLSAHNSPHKPLRFWYIWSLSPVQRCTENARPAVPARPTSDAVACPQPAQAYPLTQTTPNQSKIISNMP